MSRTTAFVLGGSAGVGRAVTEALVRAGYHVGVIARGQERLDALEAEFPGRVATAAADVADAEALGLAVEGLVNRIGRPGVWVNSAMITSFSPFEEMAVEEFDRIVSVTFLGQVNGTRLALRWMGEGRIVSVGSGLTQRSVPLQSAYCASKHAIDGFLSAVRSELIHEGRPITISQVLLPAVNTPQFDWALNRLTEKPQPAPPIYQPEVAARGVMRAIRTGAREIWVGTSVLKLMLGQAVAPGWMDRKMARMGWSMQYSGRPEPGGRPNNLDAPVDFPERGPGSFYPARAHGSFDHRAKARGPIVNGDSLRSAAVAAVPLVGLAAGLLAFTAAKSLRSEGGAPHRPLRSRIPGRRKPLQAPYVARPPRS
ncbi:SDR family oxidoreductase [Pseudoroseicyclus aestuarii]|uniref:Short-subunit dehydrogenase n=1 Tax=Pseudoroseicyclus aestuarii TaxID=1795041 RepID=A0A318SP54_9RHOB|nr:SDR family oxidoreductase [Pseudoroseicyclus aestuarii]PYE83661.1 short-subunit dehydrogenase [Pseudoroseicyclus aestuarii]